MNCNSHWMDCVYTLAVSFLYGDTKRQCLPRNEAFWRNPQRFAWVFNT